VTLAQFTLPPDTRAVGTGNPPADMNGVTDAHNAQQAQFNMLSAAFGSNPSTAAGTQINAALAALPSTGGTIFIPPGAWTLDEVVKWNNCTGGNIIVQGFGWGSQLLWSGSSLGSAFEMGDTTQRHIFMRDMRITQTDGAANGTAISANYCVDGAFERLLIDGSTYAPNQGIAFNAAGTYYNTVKDCRINAAGSSGACLYYDTGSNSNVADNNRLIGDSSTTGIHANANGLQLNHPDMEGTGLAGVAVGASGVNVNLVNPYLQGLTTAISLASGCGPVTITGGDADGATSDIADSGCTALSVIGFRNKSGIIETYFSGSTKTLGFAAAGAAADVWLYRQGSTALGVNGSLDVNNFIRLAELLIISPSLSTVGSGASNGIELANATTPPPNTPTGGGCLYVSGGALYWKGSSGTATEIATA